jgi:hypothetical protein
MNWRLINDFYFKNEAFILFSIFLFPQKRVLKSCFSFVKVNVSSAHDQSAVSKAFLVISRKTKLLPGKLVQN